MDINPQSYEEEEAEQEVYGQQVEDELEAKCGICQLSQRKLGCPERNQIFCFKCDQDQRPSPIPRTATGCVVAEINVPGDDATVKTKVWLCSRYAATLQTSTHQLTQSTQAVLQYMDCPPTRWPLSPRIVVWRVDLGSRVVVCRCDSKVRREKQFTWQRYGLAQIEIPHKAFIQ